MPAPRPRVTSKGWTYYPKAYKEWQADCVRLMRLLIKDQWTTPVSVSLLLRADSFDIHIEDGVKRPKGLRGDSDNFAKACLDAATAAGVWPNDTLVTSLTVQMEG